MEKVKASSQSKVTAPAPKLKLPSNVPEIGAEQIEGACRRSPKARKLDAMLKAREAAGKPLEAAEVEKLVKTKPDGDQAVVLAGHAQRNPEMFRGGHDFLNRFLSRIGWRALIIGLMTFIARVRDEDTQLRVREQMKKDLENDRVEQEDRRGEIKKAGAAKAVQAKEQQKTTPVDEGLSADNRLRFTLERMKRT